MKTRPLKLLLITSLWLIATSAGFLALMRYEYQPGAAAMAPETWPRASMLGRGADCCTLVMFAHPQCPCTMASIEQLAALIAKKGDQLHSYVLLLDPKHTPAHWNRHDARAKAEAIPGVTVLDDQDGIEARKFAALTSGYTVVYSGDGKLIFCGGITGGRGRAGDNGGLNALMAALNKQASGVKTSPVFGCPMFGSDCAQRGKDVAMANSTREPREAGETD